MGENPIATLSFRALEKALCVPLEEAAGPETRPAARTLISTNWGRPPRASVAPVDEVVAAYLGSWAACCGHELISSTESVGRTVQNRISIQLLA